MVTIVDSQSRPTFSIFLSLDATVKFRSVLSCTVSGIVSQNEIRFVFRWLDGCVIIAIPSDTALEHLLLDRSNRERGKFIAEKKKGWVTGNCAEEKKKKRGL